MHLYIFIKGQVKSDQQRICLKILLKPIKVIHGQKMRKEKWTPPKNDIDKLIPLIRFNTALIFCKGSPSDVKDLLASKKRSASAKSGTIAP